MAANGSPKGEKALILALASGQTVKEAVRQARVSERTAFRRLKEPDFRAEIADARAKMFEQTLGQLASAAPKAVKRLERLLNGKRETVALGAAKAILDQATNLRDKLELVERLNAIEQRLEASTEGKHVHSST